MAEAVPVPTTPRKSREDPVTAIINNFNDDYNLGAGLPDPSETPSRRKQRATKDKQFARLDKIWQGIRFLHFQQDAPLDDVKRGFFFEAKLLSRRWPIVDESFLTSGDFPKASTAQQQAELQDLLVDIIAKAISILPSQTRRAASEKPQPCDEEDIYAEEEAILAEQPPPIRSKRPSLEKHENRLKKSRNQGSSFKTPPPSNKLTNALDTVLSRQRSVVGDIQLASAEIADSFSAVRPHSFNTSKRSFAPTIFSQPGTMPTTQSTVEFNSQEKKEAFEQFHSSDDFPLSSGELCILEESFIRYGDGPPDSTYPLQGQSPKAGRLAAARADHVMEDAPTTLPLELLEPTRILGGRLDGLWPRFPKWLREAPLAVAWELTRICLHCKVDLTHPSFTYDQKWANPDILEMWKSLKLMEIFQGKTFPERPAAAAWQAALNNFTSRDHAVVLGMNLDYNYEDDGPLFHLHLEPLRLEQSCRISRRFGSDRLLEVLMPSPCERRNMPKLMKEDGAPNHVIEWLTKKPHPFLGRKWMPFFVRDEGYRRPLTEFRLTPESNTMVSKDRVIFFAESGLGFRPLPSGVTYPSLAEGVGKRSEFKVDAMLKWLLQPEKNAEQPHLKLFTRIQLGLSKTYPVFTFEPDQIRHKKHDLLSRTGNVMNDGIGLMSRSVARRIRDILVLPDIPSAVQGRLGSAKGMWLLDITDTTEEYWIETYPSQRKWVCDFVDEHHRTLEVRSHAHELRTAQLNLQLIPVLEDRCRDARNIRKVLSDMLDDDLKKEFDTHKSALRQPLGFRLWSHSNFSQRHQRIRHGHVPFLGGLPISKEEMLNFLLDSGFSPASQKYLQDIAWQLQKQKCDALKTKLKVKVGRSTYAYMVVDFWGVLEEGEVHLGFSSKFSDEDYSDIMLHDVDILVARCPAHLPSDIQRVRAVFKTELRALKDVIVFSAKGNSPLASKLSGGDYDGDQAWVCWDPKIVEGFENADVPPQDDLDRYLKRDRTTYGELMQGFGPKATRKMIERSFQFNMKHNMLGVCTSYKERFCYARNTVSDREAILLSTLLGNLVDQPKNGISFGNEDFDRFIREGLGNPPRPRDPAYKDDVWKSRASPAHIIDHLKFTVAKPAIDRELEAYHKAMNKPDTDYDTAQWWDADLAKVYDNFKGIGETSKSCKALLEALVSRIGEVQILWSRKMNREGCDDYAFQVREIYGAWCGIEPNALSKNGAKIDSKMVTLLHQSYLLDPERSHWALLKASTTFKLYYRKSPKFVWRIAGRQLAYMKALMTSGDGVPVLVTPQMYASLIPDKRFVNHMLAKMEGSGSEYLDALEQQEEDDDADLST